MAVETIACGECGTNVSFTVNSEVLEVSTGDPINVKEAGTGGWISPGNRAHNIAEKKNCPDCSEIVYALTQEGFEEGLEKLEISEDEGEITT